MGQEAANTSEPDHLHHFSLSLFATTKKSEITGNSLPSNGASNYEKTSMYDIIDQDSLGSYLDDASNTMSCLSGVFLMSINVSELHACNSPKIIAYIQSKENGSESKALETYCCRETVRYYGTNEICLSWCDTPTFSLVMMHIYYGVQFWLKFLKYFLNEKCQRHGFKRLLEHQELLEFIIWTVKKVVMDHWLIVNADFISICICNRKDVFSRICF